ncbi:MAG: helix-turn-helix domain-containing protein [Chloroflexi bacterium]|nr:helix-turn-helix domain-containing protein [Chloroflexota bacterium]
MLSVGLAARRLSLSPERVRALCRSGQLKHLRDATGRRLIPEAALAALIRRRERRATSTARQD